VGAAGEYRIVVSGQWVVDSEEVSVKGDIGRATIFLLITDH
jgi:hypothetical protein